MTLVTDFIIALVSLSDAGVGQILTAKYIQCLQQDKNQSLSYLLRLYWCFVERKFIGMKTMPNLISLLTILVLTACNGQASVLVPVTPQSSVPITGLATPSALPAILQPTSQVDAPVCTAPASLTPAVTEGPYFKAGSPERSSLLEAGMTGVTLTLSGYVLTSDCKPVAHALLDFWQANPQGQYDNAGYTLRGHQYSDTNGQFRLVTVVPGLYPDRTEHIHVKVQAPNGPILTSQLFFPGVADNSSDGIYNSALLINIQTSTSSSMQASFIFIVNSAPQ